MMKQKMYEERKTPTMLPTSLALSETVLPIPRTGSLYGIKIYFSNYWEENVFMSLSEKEKFNLIKPLPQGWPKDGRGIPFLHKEHGLILADWNSFEFASFSNMKSAKNKESKVLLSFQYDKTIMSIYNNIFSLALKATCFKAVATPDYSAYLNMEPCQIEENVRHGLWVGAWLQYLGIAIIPTITWADAKTYDICFNYIEKGSVVAISTIGVAENIPMFMEGFNEMMKRIQPSMVIVRGKLIRGMKGKFIFVDFRDTFEVSKEYEQIPLFALDKIQIFGKEDE